MTTVSQPLLELRGLQVAYGGIRAVRGIDLRVDEGELVCLIGANGAGKSTTLRAICGLVPLAGGEVVYGGKSIGGQKSHELVRQGLVMVPEGRGIFGQLTIEENLAMGGYVPRRGQIRQDTDRVFTLFPRGRAPQAGGRHLVRRRAADGGHGPRDDRASCCCCWTNPRWDWRR